jgi:hypothetical protein
MQQAVYKTLTPRARRALYSKIGNAFLQAIKPENLKDLLYELLALLNKGIDSEDLIQRQSIANLNLSKPFLGQAYDRQAGEMAFKNASFHAATYHLKSAISYFGISTWKLGNSRFVFVLSLAYERMFQAHLLLSEAILAEGDHEAARALVEKTIPNVSHVREDRAALLSVVVRSWIGSK